MGCRYNILHHNSFPSPNCKLGVALLSGEYISVLAGEGFTFKIRPTHRSIEDAFTTEIHWMISHAIKSKIFCLSTAKVASI